MSAYQGEADMTSRNPPKMSAYDPKRTSAVHFAGLGHHFFIIIVNRHESTAAARWALLLIVSTLFNDAITVAVWTGFHVCLPVDTSESLTRQPNVMHRASIASVDL